jgi:DNA helicase-4
MSDPNEMIERGQLYQQEGNYEEALKCYQQAAGASDFVGQYYMGVMYKNGWGIEQSDTQAVKFYNKAASRGHGDAMVNLGWMYENGRGVKKNIDQAIRLYTRAASKGHTTALYNLGDVYWDLSNHAEATNWYHKAAKKNHLGAQFKLGNSYRIGLGVIKDLSESLYWYEQAAHNKHPKAEKIVDARTKLLKAIQNNDFTSVEIFSQENLSFPPLTEDGFETYYHLLAAKGKLNLLPPQSLTSHILAKSDSSGKTPLHIAAENNSLDQVPSKFLKLALLMLADSNNNSVIDLAYKSGSMDCIPEKIRWSYGDYKLDQVKDAIETRSTAKIPAGFDWNEPLVDGISALEYFAEADLITLVNPDQIKKIEGFSEITHIVNLAYSSGDIAHIPAQLRYKSDRYYAEQLKVYSGTHDLSSLPDDHRWHHVFKDGDTALHKMATLKSLNLVPLDQLTKENLSEINAKGSNVVDLAQEYKCLEQIPAPLRKHTEKTIHNLLDWAIEQNDFSLEHLFTSEILTKRPSSTDDFESYLHWIASITQLNALPKAALSAKALSLKDGSGSTPLHIAIKVGHLDSIPEPYISNSTLLQIKNKHGYTCYHYAAEQPKLSTHIIDLLTPDILTLETNQGISVADLIDQFGNTLILARDLQYYSRRRALRELQELFQSDFPEAKSEYNKHWHHLVPIDEFRGLRDTFVQSWVRQEIYQNPSEPFPDKEQAEAIAETGTHIKVTARAGSGKTETLVARAIFLIKHCQVMPSEMLILAFNKKAVSELQERLTDKLGAKKTPHVKTFHSLAYQIVKPPKDSIIFNDNERDGKQALDNTIEEIIRGQLEEGSEFEDSLKNLMMQNWEKSLAEIIAGGFNLSHDEFLEFRKHLNDKTINLRTINSEQERWVGNFLYARNLDYSHNREIYTHADGTEYCALFRHWSKTKPKQYKDIVIELENSSKPSLSHRLPAYVLNRYHIIQIPQSDQKTSAGTINYLKSRLEDEGITLHKMSSKELWTKLRKEITTDFTKAVQSFIARCQKELIWADRLNEKITSFSPSLSNSAPENHEHTSLFWSMCEKIYRLYEIDLHNKMKTDYDRLIHNAAQQIHSGFTEFSQNSRNTLAGDVSSIKHFLLDEFQDFSHLFNGLREAIIEINPSAYFFCVGDDWQAINRFAGSNLMYFGNFQQHLRPSIDLAVRTNYRSAPEIVNLGNDVMKASGMAAIPSTTAKSGKVIMAISSRNCMLNEKEANVVDTLGWIGLDILRIAQQEWPDEKPEGQAPPLSSIVTLSRNGTIYSGKKPLSLREYGQKLMLFLPEWQRKIVTNINGKKNQVPSISFSTTHSYKGKQADCIILLSPKQYYPTHENNIYQTLFGDTLDDFIKDEQRLYYVGVTRAKRSLYILQEESANSEEKPYPTFVNLSELGTLECAKIPSHVLCGNQVFASIYNDPNQRVYNGNDTKEGTRASSVKDIEGGLNDSPFTFDGTSKWKNAYPVEQLPNTIAYREFLQAQPWVQHANKILFAFESDNIDCQFYLNDGAITRLGRQLTKEQLEELNTLAEAYKATLSSVLESLHIDEGIEWPEIGYDPEDCMIEIAWEHLKVGIALPDDEYQKLLDEGWQIIPVEQASVHDLLNKVQNAHNPQLKTLLILANSIKFGDRCIAGIELSEGIDGKPLLGSWVRPIDRTHPEESIYNKTAINNKTNASIKPMNCVEMGFEGLANDPFHREDWIINAHKPWITHDSYTQDIFNSLESEGLWETDELHKIKQQEDLPTLKLLKNFDSLEVRYKLTDDTNSARNDHEESTAPKVSCKLHLKISGNAAILSVTDPLFRENYQITSENASHEEQIIKLNPEKTIVIASLTKPHQGYQYLIAATIIELT